MLRSLLFLATLLACAAIGAQATRDSGTVTSSKGFAFLTKFCFHNAGHNAAGEIEVDIEVPVYSPTSPDPEHYQLVIYDDEVNSWPAALHHWDKMSCQELVDNAAKHPYRVQPGNTWTRDAHKLSIQFRPRPFENAARPRFWYFSLANCNSSLNNIEYKTHAWQSDESHWNREFGEESEGLNTLYLVFFFLFTVLVGLHCYGTHQLQARLSYLHPMLKLFLMSLLVQYLAVFLLLIHYGSYPNNGTGITVLHKLGGVLSLVSRSLFILLLLLLAKGWTISKETLERKWAVAGLVAAYMLLSILRLVWEYAEVDAKETSLGKSLEALDIVLALIFAAFALWFVYEIVFVSYRDEANPHKKSLYLKLAMLYIPWMVLYILVLFSSFALDPWVRERVHHVFTVGLAFLAQACLVFLFWPSRAEEYFVLNTPDVAAGTRGDEDYAHL